MTLRVEWSKNYKKMMFDRVWNVFVHAFDQQHDWAVLLSDAPVIDLDPVEICPEASIPPMREEPEFKLYHCPAMEFQLQHLDTLEASVLGWFRALSISLRHGKIVFPYVVSKGSSGGVVINRGGQVVAMYLESVNRILTVDEAKSDSNSSGHDAVDSAANSHCPIGTCIIISHFPGLMSAIS